MDQTIKKIILVSSNLPLPHRLFSLCFCDALMMSNHEGLVTLFLSSTLHCITPCWAVGGGTRGLQMSFGRKIQRAQEGQRNMMQFLLTFTHQGKNRINRATKFVRYPEDSIFFSLSLSHSLLFSSQQDKACDQITYISMQL